MHTLAEDRDVGFLRLAHTKSPCGCWLYKRLRIYGWEQRVNSKETPFGERKEGEFKMFRFVQPLRVSP